MRLWLSALEFDAESRDATPPSSINSVLMIHRLTCAIVLLLATPALAQRAPAEEPETLPTSDVTDEQRAAALEAFDTD